MVIQTLSLMNFRNYAALELSFSEGTNILYGDNAQGKTNILESLYMISTTKSHRGAVDKDMIRFGEEEAHIRAKLLKNEIDYQVDMHLRKQKSKGIAVNGQRIRRASQLIGLLHIVFFSPEDLRIVKDGPSGRRRFMDMELCQLDASYMHDLNNYNKVLEQRNKLLKEVSQFPQLADTLDVWDEQLVGYGRKIIERRGQFIEDLSQVVREKHEKLSGGRETLILSYEPHTAAEEFADTVRSRRERDIYLRMTSAGPHKDDFSFKDKEVDLRRFGSQGQQRTCALSLKLSEIELVTRIIGDKPVLMLDDVLSELDSRRQNYLMSTIGGIQTFITCTGLDEFVNNRFEIDRVYSIDGGRAVQENQRSGESPEQEK